MYDQLSRLDDKSPTPVVPPVEQPATPQVTKTTKPKKRTEQPNGTTERSTGSTEPSSLLSELTEGVAESTRQTERYSFEMYTDYKPRIYEVQHDYLKRTGHRVSASRIIRDAIGEYLNKLDAARKHKP
jgi:hypothetical protein